MTNTPQSSGDARTAAEQYAARGWPPIPVPFRKKAPVINDWPDLRLASVEDVHRHFSGAPQNVGVLLGEPSGWLADVDLDHVDAVLLADKHLPPTDAKFGRSSKERSHRIYRLNSPATTQKCEDRGGLGMIVELRLTGAQTVFPPSTHETGEPIRWEIDGDPATVDPQDLIAAIDALASEVKRKHGVTTSPEKCASAEAPSVPADVEDRARKYIAKMPPAVSGQGGHNVAFSVACKLVIGFGLDRDRALGLMREFNDRCQPAWSEKELAHKIDSALKQPGLRGELLRDANRPAPKQDTASTAFTAYSDAPVEVDDPWPDSVDEAAFYGAAGEIVAKIEPHSEADPMAILYQTLVAFGSMIGRTAHFRAEADSHYGNLNVCLVGRTSKGRKGTSWGQASRLFGAIDPKWRSDRVQGGLSSGEGLIWAVRDPIYKKQPIHEGKGKSRRIVGYEDVLVDEGIEDKRLLVMESEFGSVLKVAAREKNTLSAIIRQAWDTGMLRILNKNSPAKATDAHISIVGHITRDELRRLITETDMANGLANRFLWLCVTRSKCLPEGGEFHTVNVSPLVERLRTAVEFARSAVEVRRDDAAREIWCEVYPSLSEGKPGLLGAATSRAEAQTMRLAML